VENRVVARLRSLIADLQQHADQATAAQAAQTIQDAIEEIVTLAQTASERGLELIAAYGQEIQPQYYREKTRRPLPTRHPSDTKWKTHCVDCGGLILEFEQIPGWEYRTVGAPLVSNPGEKHFGGWRCKACNQKLKDFIEDNY